MCCMLFSPVYNAFFLHNNTLVREIKDMMDRSTRFMDEDKLLKNDNEKCYLVGLEDKSFNERNDDTKFTMEESHRVVGTVWSCWLYDWINLPAR